MRSNEPVVPLLSRVFTIRSFIVPVAKMERDGETEEKRKEETEER